jgi:hypothetical protein
MDLNRRDLLRGAGALGGLGLVGLRPSWARPAVAGERQFLFIYCSGGADQTTVYAPTMAHVSVPDEAGAVEARVGDLVFVDHPDRPAVRDFLTRYGEQTALLHGLEIRSISHERCQQIVLTGSADGELDDWPSLLAGHALDLPLPGLVHSGPAFSSQYSGAIIRLGETGQLSGLLDGSALRTRSDLPLLAPSAEVSGLVDAHLVQRAEALQAAGGGISRFSGAYRESLERLRTLKGLASDVDLSIDSALDLSDQVQPILDCMELGLARTGMIEFKGVNHEGFDTHSLNQRQSGHFELLFSELGLLLDSLASRSGSGGGSLLDQTVVVVFSEMGRHPLLNTQGGKDHWTFTSAMMIGSGVAGGRAYGGYGEDFEGAPIDPGSGEVHDSGVQMISSHLGATLLALGDVDPAEYLPGISPITALLSD